MLILTETTVEEGAELSEKLRKLVERARFSRRGQPGPVGDDLDRDRRRRRAAAPDGDPRPRCRCGDVLGQVAGPQPDLHLRGARRGRARPPRADLGRRAGARHGDRPAGPRRGHGHADLVHRAAPPLSRPAVGAHRRDRRRDGPPAASCPTPRSTGSGSRRCCTMSARSRVPQAILDKPAPLTSGRVADASSSTRASARSSSSTPRRCATRSRSSSITTSGSPATATRTACAPTRSRSGPGSSPSPTPTTR